MTLNPNGGLDPFAIEPTDLLWRRIPPSHVVFDDNKQKFRPSKDSFNDHPNKTPMSVFVARLCGDPQQALAGHEDFGLVSISVAYVSEACSLTVEAAPRVDQPPGHAHVVGKKTGAVRKKLSENCEWVVEPPQHIKDAARHVS